MLGEYMDHKKGNRKEVKWSPELIKRIKKDRLKSNNKGKSCTALKTIKIVRNQFCSRSR